MLESKERVTTSCNQCGEAGLLLIQSVISWDKFGARESVHVRNLRNPFCSYRNPIHSTLNAVMVPYMADKTFSPLGPSMTHGHRVHKAESKDSGVQGPCLKDVQVHHVPTSSPSVLPSLESSVM